MTRLGTLALAAVMAMGSCGGTGDGTDSPATPGGGSTTFEGSVSNPTGMLQREAEERGALCCALTSSLYVVVVAENGALSVAEVEADGTFTVTIGAVNQSVMISFVLDADDDGDFDTFEGTLTFTSAGGVTATITANGGTIDLGTITLTAGLAETSNFSASILLELDADGDGIDDFNDADDDNDGEADADEDECDEDEDLEPDCLDEDDDNDGIEDELDADDDNDDQPDNDLDEDGCDDDVDVEIEIEIEIDINFTSDTP
jgi:hypothetical protein